MTAHRTMTCCCPLAFLLLTCTFARGPAAATHEIQGQASGFHVEARNGGERSYNSGLRYIPLGRIIQNLGGERFVDLEASLNIFATMGSPAGSDEFDLELYRLKLRFATPRTEMRIGLQKIEFGPGYMLRPLMWFDRLDPRDPLQLTDGVHALRFTYTAMNNAGLWFWCLYGNDDPKGYEFLQTADGKTEFGGRFQYPVPKGELAVSVHTRVVDAWVVGTNDYRENRFALDGRWDIEIGLWFEAVLQEQRLDRPDQGPFVDHRFFEWTKIVSLGADYTIGTGNGLHVLYEHMAIVSSETASGRDEDLQVSALSLNYPLGFSDNLRAIGLYSWEDDEFYPHLSWQRTWDYVILNVNAFHYPGAGEQAAFFQRNIPGTGYGGQVIVIINH